MIEKDELLSADDISNEEAVNHWNKTAREFASFFIFLKQLDFGQNRYYENDLTQFMVLWHNHLKLSKNKL